MTPKKLSAPPTAKDAEPPFDAKERMSLDDVQLGQWYWVDDVAQWSSEKDDDGKPLEKGTAYKWLGCVMEIGSNYIKLEAPRHEDGGNSYERVHFDEFEKRLTLAPDADQYIAGRQLYFQQRVNALLEEVKTITARLGIVPTQQVGDHSGEGQNALVVLSAKADTTAYKKALVKAAEKTLPGLFEDIKKANKGLARWMLAPTMALTASIGPMEQSISAVKERIYTIELYAGLTEEAEKCCDGDPAPMAEKLRVMQRRLYMDEECLANYEAGGMEFKHIGEFDEWISKPVNRDRLLPFPRTLAAFRVRRDEKAREHEGNIQSMFINIQLAEADKATFLYIRNGDQVWRVTCDFAFEEMIIPNKDQFNPAEPMMVRRFGSNIDDIIPLRRWEGMRDEQLKIEAEYKAWKRANPKKDSFEHYPDYFKLRPHPSYKDYHPYDQSNVYFDDAQKEIGDQIKKYNRIAVIIQGLFDRSEALHPHPPVKMWDPASFEGAVELVYDAVTLTYGDKPDFELYRTQINMGINASSILTGQEDFWLRREAVKENNRIRGTPPNYTHYWPSEETGPGYIGAATEWKARAKKAVFRWKRESRNWRLSKWERPDTIDVSVEVPVSALLNVSGYKLGDFKRFFADPRTRREYLQWAPLLLAAEDYHAGKARKNGGGTRSRRGYY